jgi:YGGT family
VQEWLNWQHWKCCERGTVPWVRIPPSPPEIVASPDAPATHNFFSARGRSMSDDKLAIDEARRAAQHESVKSQVEGEVQAEIGERAAIKTPPGESHKIDQVAGEFRSKAVNEVVDTEREVERSRSLARVSQVVDYIFWVIYALLGMRFLLALLAARSSAGFVQFIVTISNPFYEPFRGIVASPRTDGGHTLLLPIVVAIIAYALLHLGINALLRMFAHRKTAI